jgi:hypothetical protein
MKHTELKQYLVDDGESSVKVLTIGAIAERWPQLVDDVLEDGYSFEPKGPTIERVARWRVGYVSVDSYGKTTRKICTTLASARKFVVDHAGEEALSPYSGGVSNDGIVRWTGIEAQTANSSHWERAPRFLIQSV